MSMMLAAAASHLLRLKPLLDHMAARCFEISGRHGDASKAKLVNNLVAGINLAAAAEGLALARELGMDERQMLALMSVSSGQSWIGDDRMRRALDDDYEPRAQTHVLTKDLTLATGLAREHGYPVPLGEQALGLFRAACEAGHRDEDDAALLKHRRNWR
jgi:3-hydroxyisobutyrate dehydrogenase